MKRFLVVAICLLFSLLTSAQTPLKYQISFPNAIHHEAEVTLEIPNIPVGNLTVRMSRSSPGRYATHEFGKNIYNIKASDNSGKAIVINQIEGDAYAIPSHGSSVKISYTIFGNWVDGTYLGIDETHAHINMPATFIWVEGMDLKPIEIAFNTLPGWKIATQLKATTKANTYTAPNLQYFMDSPTELSAYKSSSWTVTNPNGKKYIFSLTSHSADEQAIVDGFANKVARITAEAKLVFGEFASYDFGSYTFLHDVNSENAGDGMEHRNSTVITQTTPQIAGNESRLLATFSHEFFHSWNVERIRPKSLEPFNFSHANMSSELWFAEGFTQYYGNLLLKRAELRTDDEYYQILAGIINGVLNSPGAASFPATQMSRNAVFADAGVSVDETNSANMFTSYYTYGASIAVALDLTLRSQFKLTLDDYMRAVWLAHGKTEIPYTLTNLQNVLGKITNNAFADDFFRRYVNGTEKNDYQKLLSSAGLILRKASPDKVSSLFQGNMVNGKFKIASNTLKGSSAYLAGLDIGDNILKLDNQDIKLATDISAINAAHKPSDEVNVTFEHRGVTKTSIIRYQADKAYEVVAYTAATDTQIKFRKNWLSTQQK